MHPSRILLIIAVISIAILLFWAPWISDEYAVKMYIAQAGYPMPHAPDADLIALANPEFYDVSWAPFGRLVKNKDFLACGYLDSTFAFEECVANNKPAYVNLLGP